MRSTRQYNPTPDSSSGASRVYGGDSGLVHIADGCRAEMGAEMARKLDTLMRADAVREAYRRGDLAALTSDKIDTDSLCPGCYMTAGYNMLVELARANGQDPTELALTMIHEFSELLIDPARGPIEHVAVQEGAKW